MGHLFSKVLGKGIKEMKRFVFKFHKRIFLSYCSKMNVCTKMIHRKKVLLPETVNRMDHNIANRILNHQLRIHIRASSYLLRSIFFKSDLFMKGFEDMRCYFFHNFFFMGAVIVKDTFIKAYRNYLQKLFSKCLRIPAALFGFCS